MEEKLRILILEDNAADAELMVHELRHEKLDFSCRCVETEDAFLKELDAFSPDLILADYTLPDFDAMHALQLVKERTPETPVIIVTGSGSEEVAVECMKAGAFDYVLKSHLIRLAPAVRAALDKKYEREQKLRAEKTLRESERRFRDIAMSTSDWFWEIDAQGVYTYCSDKVEKILGYPAAEIVGRTPFDLMPPEEAGKIGCQLREIAARKAPIVDMENWNLHKEGYTVCLETNGVPMFDENGKFVGYRGADKDITERKRTEAELAKHRDRLQELVKQRTAELTNSNEQLRKEIVERNRSTKVLREAHEHNEQILASLSSILICVIPNGLITHWNAAAERAFGITGNKVIGKPFVDCPIRWDWFKMRENISGLQKNQKPANIREFRYERPDEKPGFLNITLSPFLEGDRVKCGFLLLGEDITEFKNLEAQLKQAQKLESIGQLAAGIAHEINTPIQYVGDNTHFVQDAFTDLTQLLAMYRKLAEATKSESATDDILREIETAADNADVEYLMNEIPKSIRQTLEGVERVANIVRAMKAFSHRGTEEKEMHDINNIIENTVTIARNEWKYVSEMALNLDPSLPLVPCLAADLNQVVLNLVVNAAQAIAEVTDNASEKKGTITIRTRQDGDWIEISISDTGTGIPEAIRDRIFDPFFTTKDIGEGTGQGLAIVHSAIVKGHGGTIAFETEEGKGTTFIIRLPLDTKKLEGEKSEETNSLCR